MTLIEAKETLAKARMCHMMPLKDCEDCNHCQLYVSDEKEQESFDYLYKLMERSNHDTRQREHEEF